MSAGKKVSINTEIKRLGIIAGSGTLPRDLYQRCLGLDIECQIVGFKGHTNYITPDFWGTIGRASKIVQHLKESDVEHLVFIGGINRPNLLSLRPDWFTLKFFFKTWLKSFGDSNVLSAAKSQMETIGFQMHGIHKFLPELLLPEGVLGSVAPQKTTQDDIRLGVQEALEWGKKDKGQAIIVKDGAIIAREDKNGTSWMIDRYGSENAILVKMCKPQQDHDMDLPTIGPETVRLCAAKKMLGIVGQAEHMLIAEQEDLIKLANDNKVFILGQVVNV